MEVIEEERKVKQAYLREAIVEAGYNPDKFVNYLASLKDNGADVDNWTLDELKMEVKSYKRLYAVEDDPSTPANIEVQPPTFEYNTESQQNEPTEVHNTMPSQDFTKSSPSAASSSPTEENKQTTKEPVDSKLSGIESSPIKRGEVNMATTKKAEEEKSKDVEVNVVE